MERKQDGLVPIGEALADLDGPVQAIRKTPPPARRSFTVADQVHQLVSASEADPDLGVHGANDGALLPAAHQPRQPTSVCPSQRPVHLGDKCDRTPQAPLRRPARA